MERPLKVLIVEDSADDAELIILTLGRKGVVPVWDRVETKVALDEALAATTWDAVLVDYTLPEFGAAAALVVVRATDPDMPFIVVSGTVSEEAAVAIMRAGANDYVLKNSLTRLAPAIDRELRVAETRRAKKRGEAAIRASESRYRRLFEAAQDGILVVDVESRKILDVNPFLMNLLGYSEAEMIGKELWEVGLFQDSFRTGETFGKLQAHGSFRYDNHRLSSKTGGSIIVEFIGSIYDAGDARLVQCNIRDITEQKRTESALKKEEAKLAETVGVVRLAQLGYWSRDLPTGLIDWSDFVFEIFGVDRAKFAGTYQSFLELVHKEDRLQVESRIAEAVAVAGSFTHSYRIIVRGEVRVIREAGKVLATSDGTPHILTGTVLDITDQEAIRISEERYRTLIAATSAIVWSSPPSGEFDSDQPEWTAFTGQTTEQLRGWGWLNAIHPEDREKSGTNWAMAVAHKSTFQMEHRVRRADGEYRHMAARAVPILALGGKIRDWVGVHTDVTDIKRAEAGQAELLAQLTLQIERMPLAYLLSGPDFRYTRWNPAAEVMFGFTEVEVLGKHPLETIVPPQSHSIEKGILARLADGDMHAHGTIENVTKEGSTITCEWYNTPLFSTSGAFQGVLSLGQDVSARRTAEDALHLRDRAIGAATQGLLITLPGEGHCPIIYVSPGFVRITGYSPDEALGRNCRFLQGQDTDPAAVAQLRKSIHEGEPCTVEILNYRKDGTPFWNELSVSPIRNGEGKLTHFVGVQADVTARRNLEEQFRQVQRMEAVGQLAGGVAHDFNNLLTIIIGYSDLLVQQLSTDDPNRELAVEILSAGERSAGLTRQLLTFSRKQVRAPRVLDLNEVVEGTEKMLCRLIGEDVQLTARLSSGVWNVRADPGQIEQVLMNLALNARDAMPQGGRLTIETRNIELDEAYTSINPEARPGKHVQLSVTDTGTGMPPDVMKKIFEPFFTTKELGKGTGLGLSTVYGIVKQSGGHVDVYSEIGIGTSFKVYLPQVETNEEATRAPSGVPHLPLGTETILLVEDDHAVRLLARNMLASFGYTVIEASSGPDALELASKHHEHIPLLITDLIMPVMNGREVALGVAALHPESRVLFVSGYTEDAIVRQGILEEKVHFLPKPFSQAALAQKVREVLNAPLSGKRRH